MDKCREEFEEWFMDNYGGLPGVPNYASPVTVAAWKAWKASRESMKAIKLPEKYENREKFTYERGYYNNAIDECKDAITSAGYKVE